MASSLAIILYSEKQLSDLFISEKAIVVDISWNTKVRDVFVG